MKSSTEYRTFDTPEHRQYINITEDVRKFVRKSGIKEGLCLVSAMHTTSGVWVNDADGPLLDDIDGMLERLAPFRGDYGHHHGGESNGDAHMKSLLVHHQVVVPITKGDFDFGPWQQIYYAEFDGQRKKRLIMKVIGE